MGYLWKQAQTQEFHDLLLEMEAAITNPDGSGTVPPVSDNPSQPANPPVARQSSRLADGAQSSPFSNFGKQ